MRYRWLILILALTGVVLPSQAATYQYSPGTSSVVLSPGDTVSIPLFLTETTAISEPSLIAAEGGLYSAEVRISQVSTSASTPAQVLNVADVTIDPAFNDTLFSDVQITGTTVDIAGFTNLSGPGAAGTVSGNITTIKIADVVFTAGTAGVTVIELIDNPLGDNTVTFNTSQVLDGYLPSSNGPMITFTVLPEPTWLGLLASGVVVLIRRRI